MATSDNSMSEDLSDSCDSCDITIPRACYSAYTFDPMYTEEVYLSRQEELQRLASTNDDRLQNTNW